MVVVCVNALTPVPQAHAQNSPDTGFASDGTVTTKFGTSDSYIWGIVLQSDGKIVVAGWVYDDNDRDFALARYNTDGSLDTSFGDNGKVETPIGSGDDYGLAIAAQADGKIIVAGYSRLGGGNNDYALARYNADGSLDTTFGNGGKVTTAILSGDDRAKAVTIQSDGKIVAAGSSSNTHFSLARYTTAGALDTTFDTDGKVTTSYGAYTDTAEAVAVQSDGKIVAAGYADIGSQDTDNDFALARYNADGTLDTSFSTDGKVTTNIASVEDRATDMTLQPDGKILVVGHTRVGGTSDAANDFALARYNADGTLDTSFSTDGKATTPISSGDDRARGVALQSDGKIVVAGHSQGDFALARYNADGSLDTTFGDGGTVIHTVLGLDYIQKVALQSDGKIVAAGYSDNNFALARYTQDGELDALSLPSVFDWTPTLTARALDYGFGCGYRSGQPQCDDALTVDGFTYDGVVYTVELVHVAYNGGTLQFILDKEPPVRLQQRLGLNVGDRQLAVADALVSRGIADGGEWTNRDAWVLSWTGAGLDWSEGNEISLSLTPTQAEAQVYADANWGERWVPAAAALNALEQAAQTPDQDQQPQPQQADPPPANQAPTVSSALADATIVSERGTRSTSLSGVFTDADGDALTVTAASSNDAVATVSVSANQSSLTVGARARGAATITVTAADGNGGTVSDAFTVRVKSAPQVASYPDDVELDVGSTRTVSLSGVFTDADGDPLTITARSDNQGAAAVSVAADGSALTLEGASAGEATITVTARDPDGNEAHVFIDVRVVLPLTPEPASTPTSTLTGVAGRYDTNNDGIIDHTEYLNAVDDYDDGVLTILEVLKVRRTYLATNN